MREKTIRENLEELVDELFQDLYESYGIRSSDAMVKDLVDKILTIVKLGTG